MELRLRIDQGPVGWSAAFFLYERMGLNGTYWPDAAHRTWNDTKAALKATGLWLVVLETTLAWNVTQGPWAKSAFFQRMKAGMESYLQTAGPTQSQLFLMVYEDATRDQSTYLQMRGGRGRTWP
jgi:hypothetical protein